jgi:hypothetical protein
MRVPARAPLVTQTGYAAPMRWLALTGLLLLTPPLFAAAVDTGGWEQIADKDGVKVYRRSVPGSRLKSMRGIGVVQAPPATVALVLLDDDHATEWVDSLAESRVVRTLGPRDYIEYNHVAMPAFVRDREFITHVSMSVDPVKSVAYIRSQPADDASIAHSKIIRGELSGTYELQAIDGGKSTLLTIELHSDPRGLIPAWVVNLFQKDWARQTIAGIRKQVAKRDLKPPAPFAEYLREVAALQQPVAR